uniref:BPTI/Kunitz inhibitor domain-containing protein n=1 Tax=Erpetoichthys calabaricus TaxID=27687 RepID=A0A8C4SGC4_ERPCA
SDRLPWYYFCENDGFCVHYTLLWYYHQNSNKCRPFVYGGCGGNNNKFTTKKICEATCKNQNRGRRPLLLPPRCAPGAS